MNRTIKIRLNKVCPTPTGLRADPNVDSPGEETEVNLAQLFLQHYFDSYPTGPPKPDPSRFEYLELVSSDPDFRFHPFVADASTVKKRALSTEIGQAFCRLLLHDHFGIIYFAHLNDVIGRPTHAAFEGMQIERACKGDIPDYLCARKVTEPYIAEAKGRFSAVGFERADFKEWRAQFERIRGLDRNRIPRRLKGYIVATRFATNANSPSIRTTSYIEDPETVGEQLPEENSGGFGRVTTALHYAAVFRKLGLLSLASALDLGYALTRQLSVQVPVWTCMSPPFEGRKYVGGYYRTLEGTGPSLTDRGWRHSLELSVGHSVFIGLNLAIATEVAAAARGEWTRLDGLARLDDVYPIGSWSSEFGWLGDGTVAAPATYFLPTEGATL
jgi:hypothetical protein